MYTRRWNWSRHRHLVRNSGGVMTQSYCRYEVHRRNVNVMPKKYVLKIYAELVSLSAARAGVTQRSPSDRWKIRTAQNAVFPSENSEYSLWQCVAVLSTRLQLYLSYCSTIFLITPVRNNGIFGRYCNVHVHVFPFCFCRTWQFVTVYLRNLSGHRYPYHLVLQYFMTANDTI